MIAPSPRCDLVSGNPEPALGVVSTGRPREDVLWALGKPALTEQTPEGRSDIFHLTCRHEPSGLRAAGHATLDVTTLGIWELFGTAYESYVAQKLTVMVTYDPQDRVVDARRMAGHLDHRTIEASWPPSERRELRAIDEGEQ